MVNCAKVIGLDVGTANLKVIACDEFGDLVDHAEVSYPLNTRPGGQVTQDPGDWWRAIDQGMKEIAGRTDLSQIMAISHASQGGTLILCDDQGKVLAPAVSWMDSRAQAQAERIKRNRNDWYTRVGKTPSPYGWLSKILWLREHEPDLITRSRRFCQVSDWLTAELTGRWVCDMNNAAFDYLVNVRERCWDDEICRHYKLLDFLPELAESGTYAGMLLPELAHRWGMGEKVQVIVGGHDQGCSALGAAPPKESTIILATGTAWVLYCPLHDPIFDPREKMMMYCHAWPGMWTWLAAYTGGGAIENFINKFCAADRANLEQMGQSVYAGLIRPEHLADDLVVIPYIYGASTPEFDPMARAAILGMGAHHTPQNVILGFMEGIAFETRRNLELFKELGVAPERIKMLGGAAKSDVWPQMVADICALPVDVLQVSAAAALGAAFLAGYAIGLWDESAPPRYPKSQTVTPDPGRKARFAAKFEIYMKAVELERERREWLRTRETPTRQ